MAFWGVEVKPGRPFTHKYDASKGRLHISTCTLGIGTGEAKSTLQCIVGNKSPVYLCSLYPVHSESLQLNFELQEVDNVTFSVIGPRSVHLCGYYLAPARNNNLVADSEESYGVDIENTESERADRSDEEDTYEDSFIDDDNDPELFPPSPVSNEEGDSRSKCRKGSHRRLRKKYQPDSVGPDDGSCFNDSLHDKSKEMGEEDNMPLSLLYKNKVSRRAIDQEMDDSVDKGAGDAGNKIGEAGGKVTAETDSETDDVNANWVSSCLFSTQTSQTLRQAELPDHLVNHCNVLDDGDVKKIKRKKKGEETETKSSCNGQSENAVQEEQNMDNLTQDFLEGNEQYRHHADDKQWSLIITRLARMVEMVITETDSETDDVNENWVSRCLFSSKISQMYSCLYSLLNSQSLFKYRQTELSDRLVDPCSVLDVGDAKQLKRKKKGREKETESSFNGKLDNAVQEEPKMDMTQEFLAGNEQYKYHADDKKSETMVKTLPSAEVCQGQGVKPKKKRKACSEEGMFVIAFHNKQDTVNETVDDGIHEDRKLKKRKKKSRSQGQVVNSDMPVSVEQSKEMLKEDGNKIADAEPSHVRTLSNGLVIQEIETGTKDGKIAALGKKISINYTGKLKETGEVFESNTDQVPFKFRLGKGEVIKGWDVGLEGMRVGEKRRLVIPPSMTSESDGYSAKITPNSWLVYDLELVKVH